ncbi:Molybdate transporter 2 [Vitis vinifera]|uniref:Molybdate transporter 2 n=1 Tax=Vitis vinifera TaxID=29760 RepID=A0A438GXZ6_VITVI|nr:Molybdate transporter 2 [Vitis vinifera]
MSSIPAALIVFILGLVLCFIRDPSIVKDLRFGPSRIHLLRITWEDWKIGPGSVCDFGFCQRWGHEFGGVLVWSNASLPRCRRTGRAVPVGGRSGASVVFLGLGKLLIGLVFGNSFVRILGQFPIGILGVLLLFAGIELAMASRDMNTKEESFVMLVCAAVSMTGSSAALGFGCGILLYGLLKLRQMECSCFGNFNFDPKRPVAVDDETSLNP